MSFPQQSLFDKKSEQKYSLWKKKSVLLTELRKDNTYEGILLKYSSSRNEYKKKLFLLSGNKLYYYYSSSSKLTKGYMNIQLVSFSYNKVHFEGKSAYSIKFSRNNRCSVFMIREQESFQSFFTAVRPYVIQENFHEIYTCKKIIGKGGFASVYLCCNKKTNEKVAVKAFSKKQIRKEHNGIEILINEIKISRSLNHSNIMKFIELFETEGSIYMVLELLEGEELLTYTRNKGKLSIKVICKIVRSVLKSLVYLDEKGIIHRDLKPSNIILKSENNKDCPSIKLIDFGLATHENVSNYIVPRCGTPGFIAPEILGFVSEAKYKQTSKSDVFSLGVLLYYLIVGSLPFHADTVEEILLKNFACKVDFSNHEIIKIPRLKDLLMQMLKADPYKRISAKNALKHMFFDNYYESIDNLDKCSAELVEYKQVKPILRRQDTEDLMLFMTEGIINGKLNSVKTVESSGSVVLMKNKT